MQIRKVAIINLSITILMVATRRTSSWCFSFPSMSTTRTRTPAWTVGRVPYSHRSIVTTARRTTRTRTAATEILPFIRQQHQSVCRSSLAASTVAGNNDVATAVGDAKTNTNSILVGGDYAGLYATFSPEAKLIPVPEHFVPESLVEWGQEPFALEVLVSEDMNTNAENMLDTRHTVTVLPETGCGMDNLLTMKSAEKFDNCDEDTATTTVIASDSSTVARLVENSSPKNIVTLEAIFRDDGDDDREYFDDIHPHRVRVQVDISTPSTGATAAVADAGEQVPLPKILSPIRIYWERKVNMTSSHGTIADGGGLDATTVSNKLGERLRKMLLASSPPPPLHDNNDDGSISDNNGDYDAVIHLPGGVTLSKATKTKDDADVVVVRVSYDSSSSSASAKQVVQASIPMKKFATTTEEDTLEKLKESASQLETWTEE